MVINWVSMALILYQSIDLVLLCLKRLLENLTLKFFFLKLVKSNQIQIVISLFRLVWNLTQFRLVQNQSEIGKEYPFSIDLTEINDRLLCIYIVYVYIGDNLSLHREKYFRNLIESYGNQSVFTIFRLIWNQSEVCLVSNQLGNCKCNLISG